MECMVCKRRMADALICNKCGNLVGRSCHEAPSGLDEHKCPVCKSAHSFVKSPQLDRLLILCGQKVEKSYSPVARLVWKSSVSLLMIGTGYVALVHLLRCHPGTLRFVTATWLRRVGLGFLLP